MKGLVNLVVHRENEEDGHCGGSKLESRPVTVEEFDKYVATLHTNNDNSFILQYEV